MKLILRVIDRFSASTSAQGLEDGYKDRAVRYHGRIVDGVADKVY